MIPGPEPVIVAKPAAARRRPTSTAATYCGSSGCVRAEPKTVTAFPMLASLSNPSMNSPMIRSTRHVSLRVKSSGWGIAWKSFSSSVAYGSYWSRIASSIRRWAFDFLAAAACARFASVLRGITAVYFPA